MPNMLIRAAGALALMLAGAALPARAQSAPTTDADPALWVVKDADTSIYLFGTIHVLKPGLSWFDEAVKAAFDRSDSVMLEMVEPDPATLQAMVVRLVANPTGPTLPEQLPEDKRAAYAAALSELGLPATEFDRVDAWYAAISLTLLSLPKHGYDPEQGAEKVITAAAKAASKPIGGLETAEQQFGYLDGLPHDVQIKLLSSTLDELPGMGATLDRMVASWSAGEPKQLAAVMNEDMTHTPEIAKVLLHDRNARWADWISKRMAEPGTVFIAVGAGHLAGKDSVQDFLARHRLKARRIRY